MRLPELTVAAAISPRIRLTDVLTGTSLTENSMVSIIQCASSMSAHGNWRCAALWFIPVTLSLCAGCQILGDNRSEPGCTPGPPGVARAVADSLAKLVAAHRLVRLTVRDAETRMPISNAKVAQTCYPMELYVHGTSRPSVSETDGTGSVVVWNEVTRLGGARMGSGENETSRTLINPTCVSVRAPGYAPKNLVLQPNDAAEIKIALSRPVGVAVKIVDKENQPVPNASVLFVGDLKNVPVQQQQRTGEDGIANWKACPSGRVKVIVRPPKAPRVPQLFHVTAQRQMQTISLTIDAPLRTYDSDWEQLETLDDLVYLLFDKGEPIEPFFPQNSCLPLLFEDNGVLFEDAEGEPVTLDKSGLVLMVSADRNAAWFFFFDPQNDLEPKIHLGFGGSNQLEEDKCNKTSPD